MSASKRVALVNPPGEPGTTPNREGAAGMGALEASEGGFRYPPHTLAAVAATLRAAGYEVLAVDASDQRLPMRCDPNAELPCLAAIIVAQPAVIGVFVSWATREADRCFMALLKRAQPGAPVVALGPSTSYLRDDLASADYVLEGEPEGAFPLLCTRLLTSLAGLPRNVTPAILGAPGYDADGLLTELDALPPPAWDVLPYASYPFLTLLSSRGCAATCVWCPYVVAQGRRYRTRSPQNVLAELHTLVQRYRPQRIVFRDPVFAHNRARVAALCTLILHDRTLAPGGNLVWECESRPDHLDPAMIRLMHLAGCTSVKLGLETVEVDVLQGGGRVAERAAAEAYLARVEAVVAACRRHDVAARLFVLAGLPGQTAAGARATAAYLERLRPSALVVKSLLHYPGIRLDAMGSAGFLPGPDAPPAASPSPEEPAAQLAPLYAAQKTLRGQARPRAPRWRRALQRLRDRLWFTLGRGKV
jgi:hypothetical protein